MTQLTDTQFVLLSTATQRNTLSPYRTPASLKPGGGLQKALSALTARALTKERETNNAGAASRTDGDYRDGLFVTPAGLAAIGVECDGKVAKEIPKLADVPKPERVTNTGVVAVDPLRPVEGATLAALIAATG